MYGERVGNGWLGEINGNLPEIMNIIKSYILYISIQSYNSVCLFVCLFVRNFGKNYNTGRHHTRMDYKVGLQKCPTWVKAACLVVLEEVFFNFCSLFMAGGHFI